MYEKDAFPGRNNTPAKLWLVAVIIFGLLLFEFSVFDDLNYGDTVFEHVVQRIDFVRSNIADYIGPASVMVGVFVLLVARIMYRSTLYIGKTEISLVRVKFFSSRNNIEKFPIKDKSVLIVLNDYVTGGFRSLPRYYPSLIIMNQHTGKKRFVTRLNQWKRTDLKNVENSIRKYNLPVEIDGSFNRWLEKGTSWFPSENKLLYDGFNYKGKADPSRAGELSI